jgi:hypothetical protein
MTKLKRTISQLEKSGDDADKLKEELIRLAYIEHFPGDVKYISLFVAKKENAKAKDLQKRIMDRIRAAFESKEIEKSAFALCKADFFAGAKEDEKEEETVKGEEADDFFA